MVAGKLPMFVYTQMRLVLQKSHTDLEAAEPNH